MLAVELQWIEGWLNRGGARPCTIVNLGSGPYLGESQLHLANLALSRDPGVELINVDAFEGPGVDIVSDVRDPTLWVGLRRDHPVVFVLSNVLEHVDDPASHAAVIEARMPRNARLIATVPLVYPHHPDPIDNGLRLSGDGLAGLFPTLEIVEVRTLESGRYARHLVRQPRALANSIIGGPFLRRTRDRWMHLPRVIRVGCAVLDVARPGSAE